LAERARDVRAVDRNITFTLHETHPRKTCRKGEGGERERAKSGVSERERAVHMNIAFTLHETQHRIACREREGGERERERTRRERIQE